MGNVQNSTVHNEYHYNDHSMSDTNMEYHKLQSITQHQSGNFEILHNFTQFFLPN